MVSWSSGRDPAWALHTLRDQGYDVRGVFTTVTAASGRLSKHATPIWVLEQQADRLGLPLCQILIPCFCSNMQYEATISGFLDRVPPGDVSARHLGFGDLLLEEIRQYGEEQLERTGFTLLSRLPIHLSWRRHSLV